MRRSFSILCILVLFISGCQSKKEKNNEPVQPQLAKDTTIISGVYHFNFNDLELWTLQDSQKGMSAALFPNADKNVIEELMPSGEADAAINAFLLKKDGQYILFDAGLGLDAGGAMLDKLIMLNIPQDSIMAVCLTHCHRDHIGGLLIGGKASFPNAEIYCSNQELSSAKNDKTMKTILNVYKTHVHAFTAGDTILNNVITKKAFGHTPGHTIYEIGNLIIIGDLLHAAALQIPHPEYSAKYDVDQKKAAETRKQFYQYIKENQKVVAGMHLPYSGVIEKWDEK